MQTKRVLGLMLVGLWGCDKTEEPQTFEPWTMEDLAAAQGLSVRIPEFEIPAGAEIQDCYFMKMPDLAGGQDYWIDHIKTAINPGSHHLNVFRVNTIKNLVPESGEPVQIEGMGDVTVVRGRELSSECWKSGNWSDWPLVVNSQRSSAEDPYYDWKLPENVAQRFSPGEMIMVQTHYVNATTQAAPFKGRVGINFYKSTAASPIELGTMFATQQSIRVCRGNPNPVYSGTCKFPPGVVNITATNGHFHSRGDKFEVFTWDGTSTEQPSEASRIYTSNTWDDPPMATDLGKVAPEGGGIWWNCHYQWAEPSQGCEAVDARDMSTNKDCCYTFGPVVETSEHCNVFLYYYPKVARTDIQCN
jgi:hypothetical protein